MHYDVGARKEAAHLGGISLDEIFIAMSDGLLCFNSIFEVSYANDAACRLFGYGSGGLEGVPLANLLPPEFRAIHERHVTEFRNSDDSARLMAARADVIGLRRDGRRIPLEISIQKLHRSGEVRFGAFVRDCSERMRMELALKESRDRALASSAAKSLFLAGVTHELRTPLNAVIGFADILSGEAGVPLNPSRVGEYAGYIAASGRRLLDMISEIIRSAHLDGGKIILKKESFALGPLLEETIDRIDRQGSSRIVIEVSAADGINLCADRQLIAEALRHGIDNALRHGASDTPPVIRIFGDAETLGIAIEDQGPGIADEAVASAGELFHRAGTGRLGLGLYIIGRILALHDGEMQIERRKTGGTSLNFRLPAR